MLICERSAGIGTSTKGGAIVVQTGVREDRLTDADPLGPMDPLRHFRGLGLAPALSSEGLGWRGIKAERFRYSSREAEQPPFENHLITLALSPWRVERHRDGRAEKVSHSPGDVGLVPAGGPPARWAFHEGEVDQLNLSLEPALVEEVAAEIEADGAELLETLPTRDPLIEWFALSLKAELEAGGALGGKLYAESLANALAVHLLREHSSLGGRAKRRAQSADCGGPTGGLPRSALRRALDYIGDNLASDPSLAAMAAAAGLSPNHFSKLFKRSTGLPPHQYVVRERTEKAKALLAGTDLPVGVVARNCGFSDQAHLTRHFRRLVGTTPARFRR